MGDSIDFWCGVLLLYTHSYMGVPSKPISPLGDLRGGSSYIPVVPFPHPSVPPSCPLLKERWCKSAHTGLVLPLFLFRRHSYKSDLWCARGGGARKSQSGAFFEKKASCRISRFDGAKSYLSRPVRPVSKLGSNTAYVQVAIFILVRQGMQCARVVTNVFETETNTVIQRKIFLCLSFKGILSSFFFLGRWWSSKKKRKAKGLIAGTLWCTD